MRGKSLFVFAVTSLLVAAGGVHAKCAYDRHIRQIDSEAMRLGIEDVSRRIRGSVANLAHITELYNEAMDYCEWKNGYRMEATTGVAKGLVLKIQSAMLGSVTSLIMKRIGYVQGLEIGTQNDTTKFWEFALCTAVPTITGALGIIPKFLWPISRQKRELMYAELAKSRQKNVADYMSDFENGTAE